MKNRLNSEFEDFVKEIEKQSFFKKVFIKFSLFFNRNGLYDKWFNKKFVIDAIDIKMLNDYIESMNIVEEQKKEIENDDDKNL